MKIITSPQTKENCFANVQLLEGGLIKAVVDIQKEIIALDAGMHVDLEQYLLESGSLQEHLWGINFYPELTTEQWIEFDSMINIRPKQGNRSRNVEDLTTQEKIKAIVNKLIIT